MSESSELPRNLMEAIRYFSDPDICLTFVAALRWPDGPECPRCGSREYSFLATRRLWKCKACKKQYSVKVGSIFEDSPIGLDKWLAAIWLIANSKNGISSHELGRAIGITQKSAWFVLHRIRLAMHTGTFDKLSGEVEADETFIGGLARNMHERDRARKITGTGGKDKTIVAGMIQRGGDGQVSQVRAAVLPDRKRETLHAHVGAHVTPGSSLYSDEYVGYTGLEADYAHKTVDHAVEYVSGRVYTNGIENFWALLKRGLHGTYVCAAPYHLFRYLDERVYTFNMRETDDLGRFCGVLATIAGCRLTYAQVTGNAV